MTGAQVCEAVLLPFVGDMLDRLDAGQLESWQERSAILAADAGYPKALSEALALLEVVRRWPEVVTGVRVLQIELDGASEWLLTDDLVAARCQVIARGGFEIARLAVADVIADQFGGVAVLSSVG